MNETYELRISKKFLKFMPYLTKTAIKVYLSLSFHRHKAYANNKSTKRIKISHSEILINEFEEDSIYYLRDFFGVSNDYSTFLKAIKQLEYNKLIRIKRSKTPNGKPLTNVYIFE